MKTIITILIIIISAIPIQAERQYLYLSAISNEQTISDQFLEPTTKTVISFSPSIRRSFGTTEYDMDIQQSGLLLRSLLEFPLDVIMVGGKIELLLNPWHFDQYRFEGSFYTSLTDPSGKMIDSDWSNSDANGSSVPYRMFSYTESNAQMKSLLGQLRAERRFYSQENLHVGLFIGFRYSKIEQDIYDFTGWQLDNSGSRINFSLTDTHALFYKVTYKLPHVGMRLTQTNQYYDLSASVAYSIALVSDVDDHILRGKRSTADINGKGALADVEMKWNIAGKKKGVFLKLSGDISYIRASGSQTQTWYADELVWDPNVNDYVVAVAKGTSITGVPHDINMTRFNLSLEVGLSY